MHFEDIQTYVIEPTLREMELLSPAGVEMVLHTGLVESNFERLHQVGGPALSPYQIEPATHDDHWENYLKHRPELAKRVLEASNVRSPSLFSLTSNLAYATAMCRIHYLRVSEPLPPLGDIRAQGKYWKEHYNTYLGAGTVDKFVRTVTYRKGR